MSRLEAFLAGQRPDDVALFLTHDYLDSEGKIANYGQDVDGGVVLVVPGDDGRRMFAAGTGLEAMEFARQAMDREGEVARDLGGGTCPDGEDHEVQFVFAFAEERNDEVGGIYAEGDVVHAYAHCGCGTDFSDRWVASGD